MPKRTVLYEEHKKLGAKLVEFAGWEMPVQYTGVTDEHLSVRNAAGLFDVSHMGTFEISGTGAAAFLDYLTPGNMSGLALGRAQYSLLLKDDGTIVDDVIVYRLETDKFLMVVNASNREKDFDWIKGHLSGKTGLADLSDKYTLLALQGPKAAHILNRLVTESIDNLKTFHLKKAEIKGIGEVVIARTGYTGEDGFEIFAPAESAPHLWRVLLETGRDCGIKPAGLGARDTLRLEMKYTLYGHEISEETNALEAGLRWVIKFDKRADFIGKEALQKIDSAGLRRKLVGFKMLGKGIPRHGYEVKHNGKTAGTVTSGTFSPSLGIPIGIAYVNTDLAKIGAKISVDIRGKEWLAEVVKTPFYQKLP